MSDHIVKAYDRDLETLGRRIAEMGGIAEKMLAEAMDALAAFDVALAQRVVLTDPRLDALQREIEESAILTIAKRQPLAVDLRECIAAIRISGDLERVGDLAKNIASAPSRSWRGARAPRHHRSEVDARCRRPSTQGRARRLCAARRGARPRGLVQ